MPPYFYLTCSRFDAHRDPVERFVFDLSDAVRIKLRLANRERVGFYERRSTDRGSGWAT
jgi:hypothetical protein